jgi:hypothetical protein
LLEAKKERVRRGPTWPAANAHTGHPDFGAGEALHDPHVAQTAPASNLGVVGMHGRGNQGKRGKT